MSARPSLRRTFFLNASMLAVAAATAVLPAASRAQAQSAPAWPAKSVRILVGSPPGGPSDITSRLFAEQLQKRTGQPVVVENRPGAGNNLAAQAAAQAEPDGYTLVVSPDTVVTTNPLVYRNMPFDPRKDLVNVSVLATFTQLLVCNPRVPAKTAATSTRSASTASGGSLEPISPASMAAGSPPPIP